MQTLVVGLITGLLLLVALVLLNHFNVYPHSLIRNGVVAGVCGLIAALVAPLVAPKARKS